MPLPLALGHRVTQFLLKGATPLHFLTWNTFCPNCYSSRLASHYRSSLTAAPWVSCLQVLLLTTHFIVVGTMYLNQKHSFITPLFCLKNKSLPCQGNSLTWCPEISIVWSQFIPPALSLARSPGAVKGTLLEKSPLPSRTGCPWTSRPALRSCQPSLVTRTCTRLGRPRASLHVLFVQQAPARLSRLRRSGTSPDRPLSALLRRDGHSTHCVPIVLDAYLCPLEYLLYSFPYTSISISLDRK